MPTRLSLFAQRLRCAAAPATLALAVTLLGACSDPAAPTLSATLLASRPGALSELTEELPKEMEESGSSKLDADADGVPLDVDNCPTVANADQANNDGDEFGDACDETPFIDSDGDGLGDPEDQCPLDPGNDADGDGFCVPDDQFPFDPQNDADGDGQGADVDVCPLDAANDADGDGLCGDVDPFPSDPLNDADGDAIPGSVDNCPTVANPGQTDSDADGAGDACDPTPFTLTQIVAQLRAAIQQLEAEGAINHGLAKKLTAAVDDLVNLLATAPPALSIRAVQSFIAGVNSLVTLGRLTPAQAALLIEPAEALIALLSE